MRSDSKKYIFQKSAGRRAAALSLILVLAAALFLLLPAQSSYADPDDTIATDTAQAEGVQGGAFEVTRYDFIAEVGRDHSYDVEEKISVTIPDQLQSIEFAIPSGNFRISNIEVENAAYASKSASEASRVTIVDPDKLSEGDHEYTIRYRIQEYEDKDDSKDMFYFNVLLPEWKQPIGEVSVKVSFPDDFPWDDMQYYAGQFGVADSSSKIRFKARESKHTVTIRGSMIPENYGITLKAQLPDGYWEDALSGDWALGAILISMGAAAALLLILWLIGGRDPKVPKERITEPVEGMSPVELGYAFNSRLEVRDVLLMVLHFAMKGCIRISEYEPKRYRLYKTAEPSGEEKMYRTAYGILFDGVYKGRAVEMEDIVPRLRLIMRAIEDDVEAGFASAENSAFTPLSRGFRYAGAVLLGAGLGLAAGFSYFYSYQSPNFAESIVLAAAGAAASLILCTTIDGRDSLSEAAGRLATFLSAGLFALPVLYMAFRVFINTRSIAVTAAAVVLAGVSAFLMVIMRARGRDNAAIVAKIRSLRSFIYHPTPKDILEHYLADSNYYYDMLLYALAFGAEESWAISFLTLDVKEPEWYTDDIEGHAFSNLREKPTTIDYARDLRSFVRTLENAFGQMYRR